MFVNKINNIFNKYNYINNEKYILKFWIKQNIYNKILKAKKKYITIHDGPPYANGAIHIGHIVNKVIKDTIMKTNSNIYITPLYLPGWDCFGLSIENNIKILNKINRKELIICCKRMVRRNIKNNILIFKKIGMLYDWEKYYTTMDKEVIKREQAFYRKILNKKVIYKKKRNISWCIGCKSVLSDNDINICEINTTVYSMVFKLRKKIVFKKNKHIVNNKIYLKFKSLYDYFYNRFMISNKNIIIYINLINNKIIICKDNNNNNNFLYIKRMNILLLSNKKIINNYYNKLLLLSNKKYIKIKINKYKLMVFKNINLINKKIINNLNNNLFNKTLNNYTTRFNKKKFYVCSKHNKIIVYKKKAHIFLRLNNLFFKNSLYIIKKIIFYPKYLKNKFIDIIFKRPDWLLSRNKNWGVNIPDNKLTFDIWFDSGVTHYTILKNNLYNKLVRYPADIYIEGIDQFRGWFNSSFITSVIAYNRSPFKKIISHGFVVDENNNKFSKSKKNFISSIKIIQQFGIEILRIYILKRNYFKNIKFSINDLRNEKYIYLKVRNIIKFIINNINIKTRPNNVYFLSIDKFYLIKCVILEKKLLFYNKRFLFYKSIKLLFKFLLNNLNEYINISKDRLYLSLEKYNNKISNIYTFKIIIKFLTIIFSPYFPFLSEEIWRYIGDKKSVYLTKLNRINIFNIVNRKKIIKLFLIWKFIYNIKNIILSKLRYFKNKYNYNIINNINIYLYFRYRYIKIMYIINKEFCNLIKCNKIKIKKSSKDCIKIKISRNKKCIRCWKYNNITNYICKKCILLINKKKQRKMLFI